MPQMRPSELGHNMEFNRTPLVNTGRIADPVDERDIKNTFGLFRASLEDALFYGGDVTRYALSLMNFRNDRKHIVVDTKIHNLMRGMCPAIPGWHTDGIPRLKDPDDISTVNIDFGQPWLNGQAAEVMRPSRYHIMCFGENTTQFISNDNVDFDVPAEPNHDLYRILSHQVNKEVSHDMLGVVQMEPYTVYEFDWWRIHSAPIAKRREWRFLIRVTESDGYTPTADKSDLIRKQSQVYLPMEYGW